MSKLKAAFLPDHIIKWLTPADRKALGRKVVTTAEASAKYQHRQELRHHKDLCQWLNLNSVLYVHPRTDKRTTTSKGVPDFIIFACGKVLCVELKAPGKHLTPEQEQWRAACRQAGTEFYISYSLEASLSFIRTFFNATNGGLVIQRHL